MFTPGWLFGKEPPNGPRYPLVGGIGHHPGALPGRDNATLPEPASSRRKCLKTGRVPQVGCTSQIPPGGAVLGAFYTSIIKVS